MEIISTYFNDLRTAPFDLNVRFSIFYLCCTVLIAFFIWKYRGPSKSFVSWLIPKEVYTHKSNLLDIKLFFALRLFGVLGVLSFLGSTVLPTAVAYWLLVELGGGDDVSPPITAARAFVATFIIVITSDFCKYWAHRAHHEWRFLWPFHAVHHSAEVLTPLTVQRVHPMEPLIRNVIITIIVGAVQGVILYFVIGNINIVTIGSANALYVVFNVIGANFRHSHIWVSYGRVLEHILISPAQHQVHHSIDTKHYNKNYGSMFAIWDWMFGTLYIPESPENLTFGLATNSGKRIEQPYPTLVLALILPFKQSWKAIRRHLNTGTGSTQTFTPSNLHMTNGFSLWLDVLRAGAALVVLFGHIAHTRFTRGDYSFLRDWNVASDAVVVFFVISGIVIAYTSGRERTLDVFVFKRITRIVSVLFPALLLTLVFDAIGTRIDMSAYPEDYYQALPVGEFLWRGMTATNMWTGVGDYVRLGTNGPLWSLSYEVGFYLFFGCAMFLKGIMRILMMALVMVLVGLPVLALLPAWWMGVMVWKNASDEGSEKHSLRYWIMAIGGIVMLVFLKTTDIPQQLEYMTVQMLLPQNHHMVLLYSNEFLWNSLIAVCVAVHLVGVRHLTLRMGDITEGKIAKAVRWVAGGSFSLYVLHYPTLHLLDATLPTTLPGYDLWLLGLTLAICFVFAALFERPLKQFRSHSTNVLNHVTSAAQKLRPHLRPTKTGG